MDKFKIRHELAQQNKDRCASSWRILNLSISGGYTYVYIYIISKTPCGEYRRPLSLQRGLCSQPPLEVHGERPDDAKMAQDGACLAILKPIGRLPRAFWKVLGADLCRNGRSIKMNTPMAFWLHFRALGRLVGGFWGYLGVVLGLLGLCFTRCWAPAPCSNSMGS